MLNLRVSDFPSVAANYLTLSAFAPSQSKIDEMYGILLSVVVGLLTKLAGEYLVKQHAKRKARKSLKTKAPNSITKKISEDEKEQISQ